MNGKFLARPAPAVLYEGAPCKEWAPQLGRLPCGAAHAGPLEKVCCYSQHAAIRQVFSRCYAMLFRMWVTPQVSKAGEQAECAPDVGRIHTLVAVWIRIVRDAVAVVVNAVVAVGLVQAVVPAGRGREGTYVCECERVFLIGLCVC